MTWTDALWLVVVAGPFGLFVWACFVFLTSYFWTLAGGLAARRVRKATRAAEAGVGGPA
jgi:hypothetical protein